MDAIQKYRISILFLLFGLLAISGTQLYAYYYPAQEETQDNTSKVQIKLNTQNMQPNMVFVSETEYDFFDKNGSTIIKLTDWKGDFIPTTCWETILYPDKSTYLYWRNMTIQPEYNNYYLNWNVPQYGEPLGNYDQEVRCLVSNKNISLGKAFHLGESNATQDIKDAVYGESYG
jgi:hypothetical protein